MRVTCTRCERDACTCFVEPRERVIPSQPPIPRLVPRETKVSPQAVPQAESDEALRGRIVGHVAELESDELRVLLFVAQGLRLGRSQYGVLDVRSDRRDFVAEACAELRDRVVYEAAAAIRRGHP